ncbi:MAG: hypothetical protein J0H00_19775 [Burkholderiales bacterium]|nr:hypothetical protein [Burkholderiales bacterium]
MRAARIAEIGRRANALRKASFYSTEEVKWLAGYVRQPQVQLVEVELLVANAERLAEELSKQEKAR